jgi:hypothetical protein
LNTAVNSIKENQNEVYYSSFIDFSGPCGANHWSHVCNILDGLLQWRGVLQRRRVLPVA